MEKGELELSLDASNAQGDTALHEAVPWAEGLQALLAAGAEVNVSSHQQRTPLHLAVLGGDMRWPPHHNGDVKCCI